MTKYVYLLESSRIEYVSTHPLQVQQRIYPIDLTVHIQGSYRGSAWIEHHASLEDPDGLFLMRLSSEPNTRDGLCRMITV